jgi:translation elongation factor EF-G
MGLNNWHSEDQTVVFEHSQELRNNCLCTWRLHLCDKMELEIVIRLKPIIEPRVPYRETIQKLPAVCIH